MVNEEGARAMPARHLQKRSQNLGGLNRPLDLLQFTCCCRVNPGLTSLQRLLREACESALVEAELTELAFASRNIQRWVGFPRVFGCHLTPLPFEDSRIFTINFNRRKIRPLRRVFETLASNDAPVPL